MIVFTIVICYDDIRILHLKKLGKGRRIFHDFHGITHCTYYHNNPSDNYNVSYFKGNGKTNEVIRG